MKENVNVKFENWKQHTHAFAIFWGMCVWRARGWEDSVLTKCEPRFSRSDKEEIVSFLSLYDIKDLGIEDRL